MRLLFFEWRAGQDESANWELSLPIRPTQPKTITKQSQSNHKAIKRASSIMNNWLRILLNKSS